MAAKLAIASVVEKADGWGWKRVVKLVEKKGGFDSVGSKE
jgi:hypothetical protein